MKKALLGWFFKAKNALYFLLAALFIWVTCMGLVSCKKTANVHTRYEINAEYVPENATLTGAMKVTFENKTENEISILKFQLYANAYRKDALQKPISPLNEQTAYYAGESYGEMVISSVSGAKSWEVMGQDENILYVYLTQSVFPNEKVVVDVAFLLKLANVNHRTGVTEKTVNLGNFFPILCGIKDGGFCEISYHSIGSPFYQDCADVSLSLTLPKDYVVASSGDLERERVLETKKEYVFSASNVRDFAVVLSKHFHVLTAKAGGNDIYYYYYNDVGAKERLALAVEAFEYYENTFGEYPYLKYSLVQTGLCLGSEAYPALAMVSDRLDGPALVKAVAKETAGQWWGVVVGNDQIENAWQHEGLSEYSAAVFFENYEKYAITREGIVGDALKEYRAYYDVYGSVLGRTDTKMVRSLGAFVSEFEYRCLEIDKPLVMLDTLRKSVGDDAFFKGLKRYYKDNRFSIATAEHLIGAFEKSGLDVRGFFESFLYGKAVL